MNISHHTCVVCTSNFLHKYTKHHWGLNSKFKFKRFNYQTVFHYYIEWTLYRLFRARALRMPLTEINRAFNVLWTRDRFIDSQHNNRFRSIDVVQREKKKEKNKITSFEIHSKLASLRLLSSPICSSLSLPFSQSSSRLLYLTSVRTLGRVPIHLSPNLLNDTLRYVMVVS